METEFENRRAEFIDRAHRKVGEGDEDTQTLVKFFSRGLSQEDKRQLEAEREKDEQETELRMAEDLDLMVGFLTGELGDKTVTDLPGIRKAAQEGSLEGDESQEE